LNLGFYLKQFSYPKNENPMTKPFSSPPNNAAFDKPFFSPVFSTLEFGLAALVIAAFLSAICAFAFSEGAPRLKLVQNQVDFGIVGKSEPTPKTIRFTNEGNEPLVVFKCRTSSSFLQASLSSTTILPGKSGSITFKLLPQNLPVGDFEATVMITSNDPSRQQNIPVRARIVAGPKIGSEKKAPFVVDPPACTHVQPSVNEKKKSNEGQTRSTSGKKNKISVPLPGKRQNRN